MERNEPTAGGTPAASGAVSRGAPSLEGLGGRATSRSGSTRTGGTADDGRAPGQPGKEAIAGRVEQVIERAVELKGTLADKLEAGADTLRVKAREGTEQVTAAGVQATAAAADRINHVSDTVTLGMERTAGWLREGDLTDVGDLIMRQVRKHPTRSLLIAIGVGYLIGRVGKD